MRALSVPRLVAVCALVAGALLLAVPPVAAQGQSGSVLETRVEGPITPVVADHLTDAVAEAEAGGYEALVVTMDTPGGLVSSTRVIVQTFLSAEVPVVVYVSPAGASASSAGAFITFAAHKAAMAPGTNIGAATPIDLEGGEVIDKVLNDSASYVEAIAEERGRNVEFAVDTVRDGRSATVTEAVAIGAVDLEAANLSSLLDQVDGDVVELQPDPDDATVTVDRTLATAAADVVEYELSWTRSVQQALANPQLALILMSIAPLAILYEFISPSGGIGAIAGGIMLLIGFFSLSVLPTNTVGLVLLAAALVLFAIEAFVPGVGVFAGGGGVALVLAGLFLFDATTGVSLDLSFLVPVAAGIVVGAVVIGRFAMSAQRKPAYAGQGAEVVGDVATVKHAQGEAGTVNRGGVQWRYRSPGLELQRGDRVRIRDVEGITLVVDPDTESDAGS